MNETITISELCDLLHAAPQNIQVKVDRGIIKASRVSADKDGPRADTTWRLDRKSVLAYVRKRMTYHTNGVNTTKNAIEVLGGKV